MDGKEHGTAPQFTDAHFKGNAGAVEDLEKMSAQVCPFRGKRS